MTAKTTTYIPACIENLQLRRYPTEHKYNGLLKNFWKFLVREIQDGDSLTCETNKWAKDWGVSSQTIRNWLEFFEERKLIKIIGGGQGRGRKWIIKFTSWVRKKIKLAIKGIKSLTKKRLDELERKYLKDQSWTSKNPENPNNVFKYSINKHTLRNNQDNFTKKSSVSWEDFRQKLKDLDSDIILPGQGDPNFDRFMAMIRKYLWKEHNVNRDMNDKICNAIGFLVKNKTFDFAVKLWNSLRDNIRKILSLIEKALSKSKLFLLVKKILTGSQKLSSNGWCKTSSNSLPSYVDGRKYKLYTYEGRQKYEARVKQLFRETRRPVIRCPRCGKQLTKEIFENPLQHYDEKRCICVYICRDRAFQHRAQHASKLAEASTPVNNSLLGQTNNSAIQVEEF